MCPRVCVWSLGVRLVLRTCFVKGGELHTRSIYCNDFRKFVERYLEAPGICNLRDQTNIGNRNLRATGVRSGLDQLLQRRKAFDDPMMLPGVNIGLFMPEPPLDISQWARIVERVNIAGDHLCNRTRFGACEWIGRQQRRLRMNFVEIFDDREGLGQNFAGRQLEPRHAWLGIDGAKFRRVLTTTILCQVDWHRVVRKPFEAQRYTDAVGSGRAEIRKEFHGLTPACMPQSNRDDARWRYGPLMAQAEPIAFDKLHGRNPSSLSAPHGRPRPALSGQFPGSLRCC